VVVEGAEEVKAHLTLREPVQAHSAITALYRDLKPWLVAGHEFSLDVKPKTRSTEQNARMWAMLAEISQQVVWHGRRLTPEEWKHVFSASLKRQDVVPGLDGGFVVLGQSTSKMTVREMSELMELMSAFAAQQGVRFTAPEYETA
jgi:hypothetical protein